MAKTSTGNGNTGGGTEDTFGGMGYDDEEGWGGGEGRSLGGGTGIGGEGKSKGKDLSHVPCRFFSKGRCEAGAACVFSHDRGEPGQQKQTCQYFIKGNCKFGHKCALAHLLPGEPISMDRKHKKAAQLTATSSGGTNGQTSPPPTTTGRNLPPKGTTATSPPSGAGGLSKSTPKVMSYSQTVQAPPAKTKKGGVQAAAEIVTATSTSNTTKAVPEKEGARPIPGSTRIFDLESASSSMQELARSISPASRHRANQAQIVAARSQAESPSISSSPSRSNLANVITTRSPGSDAENFKSRPMSVPGPLAGTTSRAAFGFDTRPVVPSQSPVSAGLAVGSNRMSPSPFSVTAPNTAFPNYLDGTATGSSSWARPRLVETDSSRSISRQLSNSVGGTEFVGRDIWGERTSSYTGSPNTGGGFLSPARGRPIDLLRKSSAADAFALEEDDDEDNAEDFLPSSLNELLTPREQARRLSRRDSNHSAGAVGIAMGWSTSGGVQSTRPITSATSSFDGRTNVDLLISRQAHSASAAVGGFLQDLWDNSGEDARRTRVQGSSALANGSDRQSISMENRQIATPPDTGFLLGPSNNSMGFLPQFGMRHKSGTPSSLLTDQHNKAMMRQGSSGIASHFPARPSPLTQPSTTDIFADVPGYVAPTKSNLVPGHGPVQPVLSPGSRALQTHAPGQSLPQGLAAGLSRLHLQPSRQHETSLAFSPAGSGGIGGFSPNLEPAREGEPQVPRMSALGQHQTPVRRDDGEDDDLFEMEEGGY